MPEEPFFSVIIPTRERADTLYFCLKSCISQTFADVEFLVSDNFSGDNTKQVVESFGDPRVRRVNTGRRISMRENYEFALSNAVGQYVIFIGDDDALMPQGLERLHAVLQKYPAKAIKWSTPVYYWPNYRNASANRLTITLNDDAAWVSGRGALNGIRWGFIPFPYLPMIYHGAVSNDLLRQIRARADFFHSDIPDVYSGVAIAAVVREYFFMTTPVSMHGASSHSSGIAIFEGATNLRSSEDRPSSPAEKFFDEIRESPFHRDFMPVPSMPSAQSAYITECLYQVRDKVLGGKLYIPAWYRLFLMIREIGRISGDYNRKLEPVAEYALKHHLTWLYKILSIVYSDVPNRLDEQDLPRWTPNQQRLVLDLSTFGVRDVFSAANFAFGILGSRRVPEKVVYITASSLFLSKIAAIITGKIFRHFFPYGGYMR